MQGMLTSLCLVLAVLQQYRCYNHSTKYKEVKKGDIIAKQNHVSDQETDTTAEDPTQQIQTIMSTAKSNLILTHQPGQAGMDGEEITKLSKRTAAHEARNTNQSMEASYNMKKSHEVGGNISRNQSGVYAEIASETITKKEVLDILTRICGEQYMPCKTQLSGYKVFKKTSVCKPCSCNAEECHISKNCCPDIEADHIAAIKAESKQVPKCISLSGVLSPGKLDLATEGDNFKTVSSDETVTIQERVNSMTDKGTEKTEAMITKMAKQHTTLTLSITNEFLQSVKKLTRKKYQLSNKLNSETVAKVETENDSNPQNKREMAHDAGNKENLSDNPEQNKGKTEQLPGESPFSTVLAEDKFPLYLVTDKCPSGYPNTEIVDKCIDKSPQFLVDNIPVYDWLGNKIYRNKWCAKCHSIPFPELWRITTDCLQLYTLDYLPPKFSDFYKLTENCTVRIVPQEGVGTEVLVCQNQEGMTDIVRTCNITGEWGEDNTVIEELCTDRNYMPYYKDRGSNITTVYKNIFCYICNTARDILISKPRTDTEKLTADSAAYEHRQLHIEVNMADSDTLTQTWYKDGNRKLTCLAGQIADIYTDDCIQIECPVHQTFIGNTCLNRNRDVSGLVLAATIHIEFQQPVYLGDTQADMAQSGRRILDIIDNEIQITDSGCDMRYVKMYADFKHGNGYTKQLMLVTKLANTKRCPVETVVKTFIKLNSGKIYHTTQLANNTRFQQQIVPLSIGQNTKMSTRLSFKPLTRYMIEITLIQKPVFYEIWLNEKFYCPRVLITLSKYNELVNQISMKPFSTLSAKKMDSKFVKQTGMVPICYSEYVQPRAAQMYKTRNVKPKDENSTEATLSLLSTTVSMVSILLVLITYSVFSELRFIPGKLFMILCFNLFLADGFFNFGLDTDVGKYWCKFIGVCIHFFWLATMFCMSFILWLFLKHVQYPLEPENRAFIQSKSNCQVFKYTFYCYFMASVCVLSNIIISHVVYKDQEYGYGDHLCYINSAQGRILTFGLPIVFVLVVNFYMFCHIVGVISQRAYTKNSIVKKSKVIVFLKLSTISGIYWTFGFISEATHIKAFEYLFIIFNGGQGFFLMWSFLLNKHIFELYRNACKNLYYKITARYYKKIGLKFWKNSQVTASEISETSC